MSDDLAPVDRDAMVRTVIGEAGNQGPEGQAAVAHVIMNRLVSGRYGDSPAAVVLAPGQFEPWQSRTKELLSYDPASPAYQKVGGIVDAVADGTVPDATGGATHFFSPASQAALGRQPPKWATKPTAKIGGHVFFAPEGKASASTAIDAINDAIGSTDTTPTSALGFSDDDTSSPGGMFRAAGFAVPGSKKAAPDNGSPALTAPTQSGSMFEAAGFKLPGSPQAVAPVANSEYPTPEKFAATPRGEPAKSYLQQIREAIDPARVAAAVLGDATQNTIPEAYQSGGSLRSSGVQDLQNHNFLPKFPSADPSTWSGGGLLKTAGGALAQVSSPLTGSINALVTNPVTQLTGNPDIGDRAGFVAGLAVPGGGTAKVVEKVGPSAQAVNRLVDAIGAENVPGVVERLKANPHLAVADVSDAARTMAQGLIDPAQPKAQNAISMAVKNRQTDALQATNDAYTQAMGASPDVLKMVQGLKDRARAAGKEAIQPALDNAKLVDTSPVIEAIDAKLQPGVNPLLNPKSELPLSAEQEELARFKQQLISGKGEQLFDANRLHQVQSDMGDRAFELTQSPNPKDRMLGRQLRDMNEKLIDQIDAATRTADPVPAKFKNVSLDTPSGKTDPTGVWFLKGDKPTFAQATYSGAEATLGDMAGGLKKYPSITGKNSAGNPITVWYKPGQEAKAQQAVDIFSKGAPSDIAGQIKYHLDNAEALGYPKSAADSYVRQRFGDAASDVLGTEGPGPYRQGRQKFKNEKDVEDAFTAGFDTLKNRGGLEGAMSDSPEAFKAWMDQATPEEVVARRLGTRRDIDQKINGVKNGSLAGEGVTKIEYNRDKLRMLFGDQEANRLISNMEDASDIRNTNNKLLAGAKTAETLAGQKALAVPKVGGGNPLAFVPTVAAEILSEGYGLPGAGLAATVALKGAHMGVQKLGQMNALARNAEFARAAMATGSARQALMNRLISHPKVVRAARP